MRDIETHRRRRKQSFGSGTRTSCAVVVGGWATNGTSMRCSSKSTAHSGTCGARSTSTATCSTFWSSRAETRWPQNYPPTAQGPAVRAHGDRHRQARQLPGGAPRARAVGAASPVEVPEQPRRELPPANPATQTAMERFKSIRHAQRFLSAFSGISHTLGPVGTCCRRPTTGRSWPTASRSGTRSRGDDGRRLNRRLGQDVSSKPRLVANHLVGN